MRFKNILNKKGKAYFVKFAKSDIGFVILSFSVWRIFLFFIGISAFLFFKNPNLPTVEYDFGAIWNMWARWDGWYYVDLSLNGYIGQSILAVFFPLYPLLIALVSAILFINPVTAGVLVSGISLVLAGYWLIKLVKLDFDDKVAKTSYLLLLTFPTAVFLAGVYTESLFLMCTIGAFYYTRTKKWLPVFILGFMAGLTRNLGFLLSIPLLYEYFRHYKFKIKPQILAVGASGFGLITYMIYQWAKFGDALKFLHSQAEWDREIVFNIFYAFYDNFLNLLAFKTHYSPMVLFEFGAPVLFIILIIAMFKRVRSSYIIWSILLLLPPIMQNMWASVNRYVIVIFPAFIIFSLLANKNKYINDFIFIIFSALLTIHTALFVNFWWAG